MGDVVDDVEPLLVVEAVRGRADRHKAELTDIGQLQGTRAEGLGPQPDGQAGHELEHDLELRGGVAGPAAGRGDAGQRAGPAAACQLERHPAAQRVADDVRGVPAQRVHPAFHIVGQLGGVQEEPALDTAVVAGHGRCEHLVAPSGRSSPPAISGATPFHTFCDIMNGCSKSIGSPDPRCIGARSSSSARH